MIKEVDDEQINNNSMVCWGNEAGNIRIINMDSHNFEMNFVTGHVGLISSK